MFVRYVRDFAADRNQRSQRFYRIVNEVPTLLMIGIVILVVVKPF
jgi:putative membrane protein